MFFLFSEFDHGKEFEAEDLQTPDGPQDPRGPHVEQDLHSHLQNERGSTEKRERICR